MSLVEIHRGSSPFHIECNQSEPAQTVKHQEGTEPLSQMWCYDVTDVGSVSACIAVNVDSL